VSRLIPFPVQSASETVLPRLLDLLPKYEQSQYALARQPDGITQYVRSLRQFINWFGADATLNDFTWQSVLDYRDTLGGRRLAGSIISNALAVLNSFAMWALEQRLIRENPVTAIARPDKARPNPHPLSSLQVSILLETLEESSGLSINESWIWQRNRRAVYLMLFAGLRAKETRLLRWSHISFREQMIDLQVGTKGGRERRVALHPELYAELKKVPEHEQQPDHPVVGLPTGGTLSRGGFDHIFDRWLAVDLDIDRQLGTHLDPHKLRTTFSTYFIWCGGNALTLQKILRHADVNTAQHYVLTDDQQKLREISQLRFTRE
jgi:integrase/recombinase XerD